MSQEEIKKRKEDLEKHLKKNNPNISKEELKRAVNAAILDKFQLTSLLKRVISEAGKHSFGAYYILRSKYDLSMEADAPAAVRATVFTSSIDFLFNPQILSDLAYKMPETFMRIFAFLCLHEVYHLVKDHMSFNMHSREEWIKIIKAEKGLLSKEEKRELSKYFAAKGLMNNVAMDMEINPICHSLMNDDVDNFFVVGACFPMCFMQGESHASYGVYVSKIQKYFINPGSMTPIDNDVDKKAEKDANDKFKIIQDNIRPDFDEINKIYKNSKGSNPTLIIYKILNLCIEIARKNWIDCDYEIGKGSAYNFLAFANYRAQESKNLVSKTKPPEARARAILDKRIMNLKNHKSPVALINNFLQAQGMQGPGKGASSDIIIRLGIGELAESLGEDAKDIGIGELIDKLKDKFDTLKKEGIDKLRESYDDWKRTCGAGSISDIEDAVTATPPAIPVYRWAEILRGGLTKIFTKMKVNDLPNMRRQYLYKDKERKPVFVGNREFEKAARCAVCTDVSGSMSDTDVAMTLSVMAAVAQKLGIPLYLFQADWDLIDKYEIVRKPQDVRNFKLKRRGYGGTDFAKPIKKIISLINPQYILYITDTWGDFGLQPQRAKVVWLPVEEDYNVPPWGIVLPLKVKN